MRCREALCVLLTLCLFPVLLYPSTVTKAWVETYSGSGGANQATAMALDQQGDVYVTGQSWNGDDFDYATMKYNKSSGLPLWPEPARYDGGGDDFATGVAAGATGDVYVTGYSWNGTDFDYLTVAYNAAGEEAWREKYNGGGEDRAVAIAVDPWGNPIVTGYSSNGADFDYLTIKYKASGEAWLAKYNGGYEDRAAAIAVDIAGNPVVTGCSWNGTNFDYLTVKYNTDGIEIWLQPARYDGIGAGEDRAVAVVVDPLGDPCVTGYSWNGANLDYVTLKYNAGTGERRWTLPEAGVFNSGGDDRATAIATDPSGCFYVTGYSGTDPMLDYATIKYNPEGAQQWLARYKGPLQGPDKSRALAVDNSGDVYVTGTSGATGRPCDYATVKYDAVGTQQWVATYGLALDNDEPQALAIWEEGSGLADVFVTGASGSGVASRYATVKYQQPAPGWARQPDVPIGAVKVKAGGCLAYTEEDGRGYIYALKGNKSYEFVKYRACDQVWLSAPAIPSGSPAKKVDDGATLARAGDSLFATKGGGTNQFWAYSLSGGWVARTPVPGSNVQYGAGAVGGVRNDGTDCIYFLKGSGGKEFYRYSSAHGWEALSQIPGSGGCGHGSCITYAPTLGSRGTVFALKGSSSTNQFFAYDVATGVWSTQTSLPLHGSSGNHEAADGAGLAWLGGFVYALKGNGTRECWRYTPGSPGVWTEVTSIGGTVAVDAGGALVATPDLLYALKGNNTLEFWMNNPGGLYLAGTGENDAVGARPEPDYALVVAPNPLRDWAVVRYSLPKAGTASLKLYDVSGALVATLVSGYQTAGSHSLTVGRERLAARGVYLLKLETGTASTTSKLIVE